MEVRVRLLIALLGGAAGAYEGEDGLLRFILSDAEQGILNYCNQSTLPAELESTLLRVAVDIWRSEGYGLTEEQRRTVHSISDGDQSVAYESSREKSAGTAAVVRKYAPALNAFRRLRGWD